MLNSRVTEEVLNAVHKCTTVRVAVWQMLTELRDINLLCLVISLKLIHSYAVKCLFCVTCVQCYCCLYLCSVSKWFSGCFTSSGKFSRNVLEVSGENCV
jgi:hypothetical protein